MKQKVDHVIEELELEDGEVLINPNLEFLYECYNDSDKSGCILEGGSRSGKTWSSIDFIIWLCCYVETNCTIIIVKETYNSFKTTLYDDFNRRLPMYGITSPFAEKKEVGTFFLFGNKITLLGADSESVLHGVGSDYLYFNELLDVSKAAFDQMEQRCRKFWWGDYNPKATDHWVFDRITSRSDVGFLKTTLFDNPFISRLEKNKIMSYLPTVHTWLCRKYMEEGMKETPAVLKAKNYDVKKNPDKISELAITELLRSHKNEQEGTADDYMWLVYGEGERTAPEGLVFKKVYWIKEFPKDGYEKLFYGCDIGFSIDPTAYVKVAVDGNDMYIQKLHYAPTASSLEFIPVIEAYLPRGSVCWADGAGDGLELIGDARKKGHKVLAVEKFPGSINYGISILKKYRLHIVDCPEWRKEQGNYKYREVNGIMIEEPIDGFNHLWDAARYAAMSNLHLK